MDSIFLLLIKDMSRHRIQDLLYNLPEMSSSISTIPTRALSTRSFRNPGNLNILYSKSGCNNIAKKWLHCHTEMGLRTKSFNTQYFQFTLLQKDKHKSFVFIFMLNKIFTIHAGNIKFFYLLVLKIANLP